MQNRKTFILLASLIAVLAIMLSGCAPAGAPVGESAAEAPAPETADAAAEPTDGDAANTLVMAIAEDTASLDPARAFETLPTIIHKATYDTLVSFPPGSVDQVIPSLAESWEISDDGTVYTFTLVDGATFSDGSPVTAEDVVFSFNRLKNVTGNPSFLAETVASVEAPDDRPSS